MVLAVPAAEKASLGRPLVMAIECEVVARPLSLTVELAEDSTVESGFVGLLTAAMPCQSFFPRLDYMPLIEYAHEVWKRR